MYKLIYLTQFPAYRKRAARLADGFTSEAKRTKLDRLYQMGTYRAKLRYLYKRGMLVLHRYKSRVAKNLFLAKGKIRLSFSGT